MKSSTMLTGKDYIESGILELYVAGIANEEECKEVELRAAADPSIQQEIESISTALEAYAQVTAVSPNPIIKPFLLATIDYTNRLQNGEPVSHPPELNENSKKEDFASWLNRDDMIAPQTTDVFAKIIGFTKAAVTAIVWLKDYAPHEVHDDEYERFLIVEGTCNIIVGEEINKLVAGDFFAIPLHKKHMIKVTSSIPCKVILQRIAA